MADKDYMSLPRIQPVRRLSLLLCVVLGLPLSSCGLRTVPPIKWVPLLGAERKVQTTDVLIRALRDRDVTVRAGAVLLLGVLGQSGDKGTKIEVARVLGMALKDSDAGLRLQAVEKLGEMESEFANKYLIGALKDTNPFVRGKVLDVVSQRERSLRQSAQVTVNQPDAVPSETLDNNDQVDPNLRLLKQLLEE